MRIGVKAARSIFSKPLLTVTPEGSFEQTLDREPHEIGAIFVEAAILPVFLVHWVPREPFCVEPLAEFVLKGYIGTLLDIPVYTDAYERLHERFITNIEFRTKNNNV